MPGSSRAPSELTLRARAKLNLDLRALARRSDGYTEIVTLFQTVDLSDLVTLRLAGGTGIRITCDDPLLPAGEANLAWRAAHLFLSETGSGGGVEIELGKRIPVAAGLGGGSSDAAAVLAGLDLLLGTRLAGTALGRLARSLGADVPFFLTGGTALGKGRGDEIEALPDLPPVPAVIVHPGVAVSAAEAYRLLPVALTPRRADISMVLEDLAKDPARADALLANDLEPGVLAAFPEVREAREAVTGSGAALARMTGSGSACFGLYRSLEEAGAAARHLTEEHPGWRVFVTSFSPRTESHWGVVKR